MNPEKPTPPPDDQTTVLNMGKFVPRPNPEAPTSAAEEGATIVIRRAASKVVEQTGGEVVVPRGGGNALPPKEMLGAVAYAYAKGVYRSEDIERKMVHDPAVRQALGNEIPDAQTIRKFRRQNRGAILATLEKFFGWARRKKAEPAPVVCDSGPGSTEATTLYAKKAAEARLGEAAFVDNMAKDDEA